MTCFYNALGKGQSNAQLPPGEHSVHCFLAYGHFTSCFHFHTAVKRTGHTFFDLYLDIKQLCDAEVTNFFHFLIFLAPHSHTHVWEQQSSQRWSDTCANICIWFLCFNKWNTKTENKCSYLLHSAPNSTGKPNKYMSTSSQYDHNSKISLILHDHEWIICQIIIKAIIIIFYFQLLCYLLIWLIH